MAKRLCRPCYEHVAYPISKPWPLKWTLYVNINVHLFSEDPLPFNLLHQKGTRNNKNLCGGEVVNKLPLPPWSLGKENVAIFPARHQRMPSSSNLMRRLQCTVL